MNIISPSFSVGFSMPKKHAHDAHATGDVMSAQDVSDADTPIVSDMP